MLGKLARTVTDAIADATTNSNLARTTAFRLRNATVDSVLYRRPLKFAPTEADVAHAQQLALRTEAESRLAGQYLHSLDVAVGNRAEFDAKWKRAQIAYEAAQVAREAAQADLGVLRDDVAAARKLPAKQKAERLASIRNRTRKAFTARNQVAELS